MRISTSNDGFFRRLMQWFRGEKAQEAHVHSWRDLNWKESPHYKRECRDCPVKEYRKWMQKSSGKRFTVNSVSLGDDNA